MKLAIFADDVRKEQLKPLLPAEECVYFDSYDDFIMNVPSSGCDTVIVAHKGATGMQGVRAARILLFHIPIVWLSDDNGFVEESYRNGCAYFSAEAITEKLLLTALKRCGNEGRS